MRFLFAIALAACAPNVDGPVDHGRAIDRDDAARLETQLAQLPGATAARVTLHRPVRDPLGVGEPGAATAAVLIVVDDRTDRAQLTAAAHALARAAAPEVAEPAIVTLVGAHRAELASVGPFTVEVASRGPLRAALAIGLALIAALAGVVAWRERSRSQA